MIRGRPRADEQPGADLRVGQPVPGQPRDLRLLRGQRVSGPGGAGGRDGAPADGLSGGPQLTAGPLGERLHPHLLQHPVRGTQLLPRVRAAALPAQPFPVQQVRPGQLGAEPGPAQPLDRLPVEPVGGLAVAEQGADAGLDPQHPLGAGHPGTFGQPVQRGLDQRHLTGPGRRLGQLSHDQVAERQLAALKGLPGGGPRGVVPAQAVVQHRRRPGRLAGQDGPAASGRYLSGGLDQLGGLLLAALPGREHHRAIPSLRVAGRLRDQEIFFDQLLRRACLPGEQVD